MHIKKLIQDRTKKMNQVVIYLTLSDVFTWGISIVITILAGLYLAEKLDQDPIEVVGLGTGIYYISRALFGIPIGWMTDRMKSDRDEIIALMLGGSFMGISLLFYPLISRAEDFYVLQALFGFGTALNVNSWRKLFASNLSKDHEGMEYGTYDMVMSLATALFSTVAGVVAAIDQVYFDIVIVGAGVVMIFSSIWAALIFSVNDRASSSGPLTVVDTVQDKTYQDTI